MTENTGLEITVIGMAGRFPGAGNIHEFWENLKNGVESISFFNQTELEEAGVGPETFNHPNYVNANGILEGIENFDSRFFDYTPNEADMMDPQQRIFHEYAWGALEDAGYFPETYEGLIGLYAGASDNFGWAVRSHLSGKAEALGQYAASLLTGRDFLSVRISYKLNLKGPAVVVHTACSTSLTAIHMACQAILNGECDMALAGGVSISLLKKNGYLYREGMISAPDGHCRTFDKKAKGTFIGNGVGVVLLKRLDEAMNDGDFIYAVVKGSAINNDGFRKIGFTAPSIEGQAEVIMTAQEMAEVGPESITYVETHGTATELGDPVEIKALKMAFESQEEDAPLLKNYCALGSVKSNIGHLDAAAGVTGFIKTVLALHHKQIPPSLHFEKPNSKIDFEDSPFYVNTRLTPWKNDNYPLRAGVSSFGIGGTNAHVVLEEGPATPPNKDGRKYQLILLSAKTESALEKMTANLANYLKGNIGLIRPIGPICSIAYTLQAGRGAFKHRKTTVCATAAEAAENLSNPASADVFTHVRANEEHSPAVIFMFPGQGAQYVDMALELYRTEPVFREETDRCFKILAPLFDHDIKAVLYPTAGGGGNGSEINRTEYTQPLIFTVEYALAKLLMDWGIKPFATIGHSIGEYVSACLSGLFSLEGALTLVAARGRLMQDLPGGAMLSVPLSEKELVPLLDGFDRISPAAVNSTSHCVVSGPHDAVDAFARGLKDKGLECRRLHTSHAFHSRMMDPILNEFERRAAGVEFEESSGFPYISNITGTWARAEDAASPRYWADHIQKTVRFGDGIGELLSIGHAVFLEVGPGRSLSTFVRQHEKKKPGHIVINLIRHPNEDISDSRYLLTKIGHLWGHGIGIDWERFHHGEKPKRIPLPTYPFEALHYPFGDVSLTTGITPKTAAQPPRPILASRTAETVKKQDISRWFHVPSWKSAPIAHESTPREQGGAYLVFANETKPISQLLNRLKRSGRELTLVNTGTGFTRPGEDRRGYTVNPARVEDYRSLFEDLKAGRAVPRKIIHCWNVTGEEHTGEEALDLDALDETQDLGFFSLLDIARAMGEQSIGGGDGVGIEMLVLTDRMQAVTAGEIPDPQKATIHGALQVIPVEYPGIRCRGIDIRLTAESAEYLAELLETEIETGGDTPVLYTAYRDNRRWVPAYVQTPLEKPSQEPVVFREKGIYLVTGGLGGIGLVLAQYLAGNFRARLILTGRSPFPDRGEWDRQTGGADRGILYKIRKIREMEAAGAEVLVLSADAADPHRMLEVAQRAEERFGPVNGIIHAAGVPDRGLIVTKTREAADAVLAPKVKGTLILDDLFNTGEKRKHLDFFVLCSSVSSVLSPVGQVAYCAANAFLDSFAHANTARTGTYTVSIGWDTWREVGMAVNTAGQLAAAFTGSSGSPARKSDVDHPLFDTSGGGSSRDELLTYDMTIMAVQEKEVVEIEGYSLKKMQPARPPEENTDPLEHGLLSAEGVDVFRRILARKEWPQLLVSTIDLSARIEKSRGFADLIRSGQQEEKDYTGPQHPRPQLSTLYAAPAGETQRRLALIWQQFLGIHQVGIHDDFFELGGDSLKVMTLVSKIHKGLNVEIPMTDFFNRPTIEKLARYIDASEKHDYSPIDPVEAKEYYPLSPTQRRLYMLQQLDKEDVMYNLPVVVTLEGELREKTLEETFRKLIARHESLRTSFHIIHGDTVQVIREEVDFRVEYHETPGVEIGDGDLEIILRVIRPFDLSRAPLMRVALIKKEENKHILVVDIHHIVSDGVSHSLFSREFMAFYQGEVLPPLRIQYKDYSHWRNSQDGKDASKKQEEYWLTQFQGDIPVSELPVDFERPDVQSFDGATLGVGLNSEMSGGLKKIAVEEETSIFNVLTAIFNVLLSKFTGRHDISIGTQTAGRRHNEIHNIIGVFLNTLVLRNYPRPERTFADFLRETRKRTLEAFENQEYPFENLVEKVMGRRDIKRNPMFDVMFIWQNFEMEAIRMPGLTLKPYPHPVKNRALIDISIYGQEAGDTLIFNFEYNTTLFKEGTIRRFIDYFKEITAAVTADRSIKLKDIKISHDMGIAKAGVLEESDDEFGF